MIPVRTENDWLWFCSSESRPANFGPCELLGCCETKSGFGHAALKAIDRQNWMVEFKQIK